MERAILCRSVQDNENGYNRTSLAHKQSELIEDDGRFAAKSDEESSPPGGQVHFPHIP